MNQEETSSGLSVTPLKRRRGRPPKDPSLKRNPNGPHLPPVDPTVGQAVTGVVEATLDSGYLLNVRIGNSPMSFRGIVFKPGHYVPITTENDVAPQLQMIKRNDLYTPEAGPPRRRKYTSRRAATVAAPPVVPLGSPNGSPESGGAGWILGLGGKDVHMVEPLSMLPPGGPVSSGQVLLPESGHHIQSDVENEGSSESSDSVMENDNELLKETDVGFSNEAKPFFDCGPGKMTDLLQAVEMRENTVHFAEQSIPGSEFGGFERVTSTTTEADPRNEASGS